MGTNPNEPNYPYSGGTDNPGDDTSKAGGGVQTETGAPPTAVLHPPIVAGLAGGGTDTLLPPGVEAVPPSGAGFESGADYGEERSAGGGPDATGREPGQDEVAGATETSSDQAPASFPEPNP
jgi:hypothetical protein